MYFSADMVAAPAPATTPTTPTPPATPPAQPEPSVQYSSAYYIGYGLILGGAYIGYRKAGVGGAVLGAGVGFAANLAMIYFAMRNFKGY
jgi:hypothetical protein